MNAGEEMLARILEESEIDESRTREYQWEGKWFLRVFVKKHKLFAWDGPRTDDAIRLVNEAMRKRR